MDKRKSNSKPKEMEKARKSVDATNAKKRSRSKSLTQPKRTRSKSAVAEKSGRKNVSKTIRK